MTLPPSIRIFFAIDLPPAVRDKMSSFILGMKKRARTSAIRWSKPENLHITLQFLPEVVTGDLPELIGQVRAALNQQVQQSLIAIGHLHLFPSPFHPRVIVLDVTPQQPLADLSVKIGEGIKLAGYKTEDRAYKAHLTIGRIKNARGVDLSFLSEFTLPAIEPIPLNKVMLFRSEPKPEGSQYTVLDEIALTKQSDTLVLNRSPHHKLG